MNWTTSTAWYILRSVKIRWRERISKKLLANRKFSCNEISVNKSTKMLHGITICIQQLYVFCSMSRKTSLITYVNRYKEVNILLAEKFVSTVYLNRSHWHYRIQWETVMVYSHKYGAYLSVNTSEHTVVHKMFSLNQTISLYTIKTMQALS